jgi:AcrR family transcriptional regulator
MRTNGTKSCATRERLLQAAGEVFALKGFHKATVREIVSRARANLNAVNYHFGDKAGLYEAVLESGHVTLEQDEELLPARDEDLDPANRLRLFVRAFLIRGMAKHESLHHARLMAREMAEPTGALDTVIERYFRPRFNLLMEILTQIADPKLPRQQLELCAESIIGQCIHLVLGRPVIMRMLPQLTYSKEDLERLADHVTQFSLTALRHLEYGNGEVK